MCTVCLLRGWLCAGFGHYVVAWSSGRPFVHALPADKLTNHVLRAIDGMTDAIRTRLRLIDRSVQCMTIGAWQSVCGRKRPRHAGMCRNDRVSYYIGDIPGGWFGGSTNAVTSRYVL